MYHRNQTKTKRKATSMNSSPKLAGYAHIIDDGEADGHGYFLPKQEDAQGRKSVSNCGVSFADVPVDDLVKVLAELSRRQRDLLAGVGINF